MTSVDWRPVTRWEGFYEVSSTGRVRRVSNDRERVLTTLRSGYIQVTLTGAGQRSTRTVHTLVADAFLENPEGLPYVRHLNDVKGDNRVENLSWGTASDNTRDSLENGTHWNTVKQYCVNGHRLVPENLRNSTGRRVCKTCDNARKNTGLPPGDKKHGTAYGYLSKGCRCERCREAGKFLRMKKKAGKK